MVNGLNGYGQGYNPYMTQGYGMGNQYGGFNQGEASIYGGQRGSQPMGNVTKTSAGEVIVKGAATTAVLAGAYEFVARPLAKLLSKGKINLPSLSKFKNLFKKAPAKMDDVVKTTVTANKMLGEGTSKVAPLLLGEATEKTAQQTAKKVTQETVEKAAEQTTKKVTQEFTKEATSKAINLTEQSVLDVTKGLTMETRANSKWLEKAPVLLGVSKDATVPEMKTACKKLMKELHPDAGKVADDNAYKAVSYLFTLLKQSERVAQAAA